MYTSRNLKRFFPFDSSLVLSLEKWRTIDYWPKFHFRFILILFFVYFGTILGILLHIYSCFNALSTLFLSEEAPFLLMKHNIITLSGRKMFFLRYKTIFSSGLGANPLIEVYLYWWSCSMAEEDKNKACSWLIYRNFPQDPSNVWGYVRSHWGKRKTHLFNAYEASQLIRA